MCQLLRGVDVDFLQFLDESWTEVPSPSLAINEVSSTILNKPQEAKKKKKKYLKHMGIKKRKL
jgi:Uma2 family endonuclease